MVNPTGLSNAINKVAEQGAKEALSKPQDAKAEDLQRFQEAMQQQGPAGQSTGAVDRPGEALSTAAPEHSKSTGDAILHGMDKMREEGRSAIGGVDRMASSGQMKPEELLRLKREVDRMAFEEQAAVQGTDKADKDLNQLLKGQ